MFISWCELSEIQAWQTTTCKRQQSDKLYDLTILVLCVIAIRRRLEVRWLWRGRLKSASWHSDVPNSSGVKTWVEGYGIMAPLMRRRCGWSNICSAPYVAKCSLEEILKSQRKSFMAPWPRLGQWASVTILSQRLSRSFIEEISMKNRRSWSKVDRKIVRWVGLESAVAHWAPAVRYTRFGTWLLIRKF